MPASLTVRDLVVANAQREAAVNGVSFMLAPGEILGIAGVQGNGQTELIEAIAGLRPVRSGSISLGRDDITGWNVRARSDAGLAHIPEDRHARGLILDYSIADNLILGKQHRFTTGRFGHTLDRARIAENARRQIDTFDIRPPVASLPARALSGGNQQKIVIAREMGGAANGNGSEGSSGGREFRVLLAAQPTRGVDVGAIEFIHAQLRAARAAGKAVLLVSADLTEILALADRIAVMYRGRVLATLDPDTPREQIGLLMAGITDADAATDPGSGRHRASAEITEDGHE